MSTFREFHAGLQAGQQMRRERTETEARAKASALFGAGDYDGAESAMLGAGLYEEGSALAGVGARRKADARQKTYGAAFAKEGYAGVRAAAGAEGDIGTAASMDEMIRGMTQQEREDAGLRASFLGNAAYGLAQIQDPAQRQAALMEMVETSGAAFGITPEQAANFDLSDANLKQTYENSMSVADRLAMKRDDERYADEGERWQKGYDLSRRGVEIAEEELGLKKKLAAAPKPPELTDESTMRTQYMKQVQPFVEIRDAYGRVRATKATPAGDVALVYGIMKMIDPGAAVMEGDIANASNTTGVPGMVMNTYNRLVTGGNLNAQQRKEFMEQALGLYEAAELGYGATLELWRETAASAGLDPARTAPDFRVLQFGPIGDGGGGGGAAGGGRPSLDDIFSGPGTD